MNAWLSCCVPGLVSVLLLSGCQSAGDKLPRYDVVAPFSLTDQDGKGFSSDQLQGKVWIADFIYTRCPGPCPMMTAKMHTLAGAFASDARVQFVSFSVDPSRDTPEALTSFAGRFGAPTTNWHFLTGNRGTLQALATRTFKVATSNEPVEHSTKFILVDQRGQIRGYYSTFDAESQAQLKLDIDALR